VGVIGVEDGKRLVGLGATQGCKTGQKDQNHQNLKKLSVHAKPSFLEISCLMAGSFMH
jgi:hypothetical protein